VFFFRSSDKTAALLVLENAEESNGLLLVEAGVLDEYEVDGEAKREVRCGNEPVVVALATVDREAAVEALSPE
jgi:hypothetical protein